VKKEKIIKSIGETQEVLEAVKTIGDKVFNPESCIGSLSVTGISLTELKREVIAMQVRLETMIRIATRVASTWKD